MPHINITNLDFDSIKNNFKEYLKSQEKFKDYNFDGSSISVFLDILAYNTFYNSFYTNVIANEMFLDSATDRAAVVSRAKALGYTSDSTVSAAAYVDLESHVIKQIGEIPPGPTSTVSLSAFAEFLTTVQEKDYTFLTLSSTPLTYDSDGGSYWVYKASNVKITEGKRLTFSWKVQNEFDKYQIPNAGVDLTTLTVRVRESEASTANTLFIRAGNIQTVESTDAVYWAYEDSDEKFYIEFGNDVIGKKVNIGNVIDIEYVLSKGAGANGATSFTIGNYQYANTSIQEQDGLMVTNSSFMHFRLANTSSSFTETSFVRGLTSNSTGYVYSYDANNFIVTTYSTTGSFFINEQLVEEAVVDGNFVYGANGTIIAITSETSSSFGGADIETVSNIKFYAPKTFSAQNRLVTANDYEGILKNEYPYLSSVVAWGGEEESPMQLGHVFVSVKPTSKEKLDQWEKDYILDTIIEPRKMIGMDVHMVDADYVYILPSIEIKYNADISASLTQEDVVNDVRSNIFTFCSNFCNRFKNTFYYSPFTTNIDASNDFILSNSTYINILKHFEPILNYTYTSLDFATLRYSNPIYPHSANGVSYIVTSSTFTANVSGTLRTGCTFDISGTNSKVLVVANSTSVLVNNAGTIDYANGIIYISNVNIATTDTLDASNNNIIKMFVKPHYNDLVSSRQQILKIYPEFDITATPVRITR